MARARAIGACLSRLMPHVDPHRVALTGGVALDLHAAARGRRRRRGSGPPADVDLVAAAPDAVRATVAEAFLVSHFHLPQPGYPKFLIQLVEPSSGVRVDVFPDTLGGLPGARRREAAGVSLLVLAPGTLLEHKLALLATASAERPVDAKHYRDALLLAALLGRAIPPVPASSLGRTEYSRDVAAPCGRCDASRRADFPLAPKPAILALLGHV